MAKSGDDYYDRPLPNDSPWTDELCAAMRRYFHANDAVQEALLHREKCAARFREVQDNAMLQLQKDHP